MIIVSILGLTIGSLFMLLGFLQFIFDYPFSNTENSGPNNIWELILMISYDHSTLLICTGLIVVAIFQVLFKVNMRKRHSIKRF